MSCGKLAVPAMVSNHLPIELVIEILSRLPVKSLLRFKSVCKNWYALVKSTNFIAKHQTQSTLNSNIDSNALLIIRDHDKHETLSLSTYLPFNNDHRLIKPDFPFLNSLDVLDVLGICNGLVCIHFSPMPGLGLSKTRCLILCNPATRQFREIQIPDYKWRDDNVMKFMGVCFGFGFHPSAKDYVLIRITYYRNIITGGWKLLVHTEMYMMGTDIWRDLDVTMPSAFDEEVDNADFRPCQLHSYRAAVFINGVIYWSAQVLPRDDTVIVALDLGDEVFRKIRTPFRDKPIGWKLVGLKDKLAMVVNSYSDGLSCFDVWVLNEYQRTWTNQFRVGPFSGVVTIAGCANNGELILRVAKYASGVKLYLYDVKTEVAKDILFDQDPCPDDMHLTDFYMYVETLLPVKKNNEY